MESVDIYTWFLIAGGVGVILLSFLFFLKKGVGQQKELDDRLCDLFYKQHAFLIIHKNTFFAFDKVKETLFYEKKKLLANPLQKKEKEAYLPLGENDLRYIQQLVQG